jgi:uncharacterized damage-inducible protein DinB
MMNEVLSTYNYNGARSLVLLHEHYIVQLLITWHRAKTENITLPKTDDPDYESLDKLLNHVFRSARGYMVWMCDKLNLPDPQIEETPQPELLVKNIDRQSEHLLTKWRLPLVNVDEEKFHSPTFKSNWGVEYSIDAMLEHAVMHLIRHEFQLQNLIETQKVKA